MASLAQIWRYPIKSIGRERLSEVTLSEGKILPFDRHWAITNQRSKVDPQKPTWNPKAHFIVGAKIPELQAIECVFDQEHHQIKLSHPNLESIILDLADPKIETHLSNWLTNLYDITDWKPQNLVHLESGFTDNNEPLISLHNLATLHDLSAHVGKDIEVERWRGNLWIDSIEPWSELDMIGQRLSIGDALLEITMPIDRCKMTSTNPQTGNLDMDMPQILREYKGHKDFGVFARVIEGGEITQGSKVKII